MKGKPIDEIARDTTRTVVLWALPVLGRVELDESSWPSEFYALDVEDDEFFARQLARAFQCKVTITTTHKTTVHSLKD